MKPRPSWLRVVDGGAAQPPSGDSPKSREAGTRACARPVLRSIDNLRVPPPVRPDGPFRAFPAPEAAPIPSPLGSVWMRWAPAVLVCAALSGFVVWNLVAAWRMKPGMPLLAWHPTTVYNTVPAGPRVAEVPRAQSKQVTTPRKGDPASTSIDPFLLAEMLAARPTVQTAPAATAAPAMRATPARRIAKATASPKAAKKPAVTLASAKPEAPSSPAPDLPVADKGAVRIIRFAAWSGGLPLVPAGDPPTDCNAATAIAVPVDPGAMASLFASLPPETQRAIYAEMARQVMDYYRKNAPAPAQATAGASGGATKNAGEEKGPQRAASNIPSDRTDWPA